MNTPIYEHHRRNLQFQYDDRKFDLRAIYVDLRACGPVVRRLPAGVGKMLSLLPHALHTEVVERTASAATLSHV